MLSWQQALAAFLTSSLFASLIAALAAALTSRNAATGAVQAHAAQSAVNSAATQAKLDAVLGSLRGGGGGPALPPVLNQLAQRGPAADVGLAAQNDCGEECAAMVVRAKTGVPVTGGFMRLLLGRATAEARTWAMDICAMLSECGISSHPRMVDAATAATEIGRNIDAGHYSIVLGYWISPEFLHWRLVTNRDIAGGFDANDPYGGFRAVLGSDFATKYAGQYVHIDR